MGANAGNFDQLGWAAPAGGFQLDGSMLPSSGMYAFDDLAGALPQQFMQPQQYYGGVYTPQGMELPAIVPGSFDPAQGQIFGGASGTVGATGATGFGLPPAMPPTATPPAMPPTATLTPGVMNKITICEVNGSDFWVYASAHAAPPQRNWRAE